MANIGSSTLHKKNVSMAEIESQHKSDMKSKYLYILDRETSNKNLTDAYWFLIYNKSTKMKKENLVLYFIRTYCYRNMINSFLMKCNLNRNIISY